MIQSFSMSMGLLGRFPRNNLWSWKDSGSEPRTIVEYLLEFLPFRSSHACTPTGTNLVHLIRYAQ